MRGSAGPLVHLWTPRWRQEGALKTFEFVDETPCLRKSFVCRGPKGAERETPHKKEHDEGLRPSGLCNEPMQLRTAQRATWTTRCEACNAEKEIHSSP